MWSAAVLPVVALALSPRVRGPQNQRNVCRFRVQGRRDADAVAGWLSEQRFGAGPLGACSTTARPVARSVDYSNTNLDDPNDPAGFWRFSAPASTRVDELRLWRFVSLSTTSGELVYELSGPSGQLEQISSADHESLGSDDFTHSAPRSSPASKDSKASTFRSRCIARRGSHHTPGHRDGSQGRNGHRDLAPRRRRRCQRSHEDGAMSGTDRLSLSATDEGAGLQAASLLVDGKVVSSAMPSPTVSSCAPPYTVPAPCLGQGRFDLDLDTTKIADGVHSVAAQVVDAGGKQTTRAVLGHGGQRRAPGGSTTEDAQRGRGL